MLSGASEVIFLPKTIAYNRRIQLGCEKSLAQKFKFLETAPTIWQSRHHWLPASTDMGEEMQEIFIRNDEGRIHQFLDLEI